MDKKIAAAQELALVHGDPSQVTLPALLDYLETAEKAEDGLTPGEIEVAPDRVQVLTVHAAPVYARQAFRAGADGFVTKQEMGETVLLAIRSVLKGEKYMSAEIRATLARE